MRAIFIAKNSRKVWLIIFPLTYYKEISFIRY